MHTPSHLQYTVPSQSHQSCMLILAVNGLSRYPPLHSWLHTGPAMHHAASTHKGCDGHGVTIAWRSVLRTLDQLLSPRLAHLPTLQLSSRLHPTHRLPTHHRPYHRPPALRHSSLGRVCFGRHVGRGGETWLVAFTHPETRLGGAGGWGLALK